MNDLPDNKPAPKYVAPNPQELAGDIIFTQNACRVIMGASEKVGLKLSEDEQREMDAIIALDALPAKAIAMGAYTGLVGHEVIFQSWTKTRNVRDMLASRAMMIFAEVLDGRKITAQQARVCEKMLEWSGMGSAPAPISSDADKFDQMAAADVAKLTDSELHAKLMQSLKKKGA